MVCGNDYRSSIVGRLAQLGLNSTAGDPLSLDCARILGSEPQVDAAGAAAVDGERLGPRPAL